MSSFENLGLSEKTLQAIHDAGYVLPTPIQEQAIPYILMLRDVLGCAQTGTGKTASFTLPIIEILSEGRARARMPRSLILEPTRELAMQVAESFRTYGKYHSHLSMALLIGGENMESQVRLLDRGVDVLIATPGRLLDLIDRGKVLLNDIKIFVIDEADRMLDMGFMPDVERISEFLPKIRQTLFFSATMPPEIRKIAERFLINPKEVSISPPSTAAENVEQIVYEIPTDSDWQKREALRILLRRENVRNAFIFCNRKLEVMRLCKSLKRHGFNAGALHGDMEQSDRSAILEAFRNGDVSLLVCSDVAARGIDIADVSHVFNFDVPSNPEDYVHRIGRTGRAGKSGIAITLASPEENDRITAIENLLGQKITRGVIENLPKPAVKIKRGKKEKNRKIPLAVVPLYSRPADKQQAKPMQKRKSAKTNTAKQKDKVISSVFGDDLPAFLARPVVISRKTA